MKKNLREEELFLILVSFWATVLLLRGAIFYLAHKYSVIPEFVVANIHIHHCWIGLGLLLVCGLLYFFSGIRNNFFHLLFLGIGYGLAFDEFSMWQKFNGGDYWAIENFMAIGIFGGFLFVLYFLAKKFPKYEDIYFGNIHSNPDNPFISVVIPAYNEEKFLKKALLSIVNQNYDNFELIIVDNNSSDKTAEISRSFGAKVILEKKQGVVFARQAGFMEARGEIIATTDADTMLPKNWLSVIAEDFKKNEKLVIYGGICNLYSGSIAAKFSAYYLLYPYRYLDRFLSGGWSMAGANFAVRKKAFLNAGGFNTKIKSYEDIELSQRMKSIGESKLNPSLRVETSGRRFGNGLFAGLRPWVVNEVIRIFEVEKEFLSQSDIREEKFSWAELSFVPGVLCIVFLFSLFYFSNSSISEAAEARTAIFALKIQNSEEELKDYLEKTWEENKRAWKINGIQHF